MAKTDSQKLNKKISRGSKETIAILVVIALIAAYIFYECYSATHVPLQTYTALTATVYESIETTALAVRDEQVIVNDGSAVTVACANDGEKVEKNGRVAMQFSSSADAQNYVQRLELQKEMDAYLDLESKSTGSATDVQAMDSEILNDANDYIRRLASADFTAAQAAAQAMNDTLTRRQLIIGTEIDFSSIKGELQSELDALGSGVQPAGYVTTDASGIFSGYTDGCETAFDYDSIQDITAGQLDKYMQTAKAAKGNESAMGKLITSYSWYFCCKVPTADIHEIENGDKLQVAIKDSDRVLTCTVVSGAEVRPGTEETVLLLQCADMDSEIASYRLEDIEIRYAEHTGIQVPVHAVHVSDGQKGVYVLVAGQVKFRQAQVVYTAKDYVILEYDPENADGIRLYDEIITEGKELYSGKVYT